MKKVITLVVAFYATVISCLAQDESEQPVIHRQDNGIISSVKFSGSEKDIPESANAFFQKYLKAKPDDSFQKVPHQSKREGFVHEHYDQYYKGVKVEGAGYNIHFKNTKMYFANGHYVNVEELNTTPAISLEEALNAFLKHKAIENETVVSTITDILVKEVVTSTDKDTTTSVFLTYRIYLESDHPNNTEVGYVNAHTGEIVATEPRLTDLTGTFATRYSGSRQADTDPVTGGHRLFDNTRGATIHTRNLQNSTVIASAVELIDNDNNWTTAEHSANENDMGLDVHWALQEIYDYLHNAHNINSFDDAGFGISAYFRYGSSTNDRDNARWNNTANYLAFGDGENTFSPLASIDVVAHEFGHGITDFQIGWSGTFDQAAFNEGMSDIWAAILEQRIRPSSAWRIGEQVMANGKSYLRNLQNTSDNNAHSKIADTFGSTFYNNAPNENDLFYIRSGVLSHWFYILANGESGTNEIGNGYNVTGIGLDRAEELIVEAVFNNYLDGTTTYAAIRTAMIEAAEAIFCENSPEVRTVTNAWHAVGVGATYNGTVMTVADNGIPVCDGSVSFSLQNVQAGANVNWTVGPSNLITSAPSGSGATANVQTITGTGGGAGIQFTVSTATCNSVSNYYFDVGIPPTPDMVSNPAGNPIIVQPNTPIQFVVADIAPMYWEFEGNASHYTYSLSPSPVNYQCNFTPTSSGNFKVKVRANYGCGYSAYDKADVICSRPDLTIQSLSAAPSGSTVTLSYDLKNIGLLPAPSPVVKYYRSPNSTYDVSDTYLGTSSYGNLAANGTVSSGNVTLTLSGSGSYILAYADPSNVIAELLETNNVQARILMEMQMMSAGNFAVYPVPFENELNVNLITAEGDNEPLKKKETTRKIYLVDFKTSAIVYQIRTSDNDHLIDTRQIPSGQYVLIVKGDVTESLLVVKK